MKHLLLLTIAIGLIGCESMQRRGSIEGSKEFVTTTPDPDMDESTVEVKTKEVPKIGLIFGPGSIRTLAHSGVVDAFKQEKVPVHAVVGLGWGALVGGYFASEGNVTEVQWQLTKLKNKDLVNKTFLSGKIERQSVKEFIEKVLPKSTRDKNISRFQVPFACPTMSYLVGNPVFKNNGRFGKIMERCLPTPPLFSPSGVWMADVNAIEESIRYLKQAGANSIVYINVLAGGDLFSKKQIEAEPETALYWMQVRRSHQRLSTLKAKYPEFRELAVKVTRQQLLDAGNLRLLPLAGKRAGNRLIDELKEDLKF